MDTGDTMFREWNLYDLIGRSNYMRHREVFRALRDTLRDRSGPVRVLDLGCGDGWMAEQVLAGSQVVEYVGVDLSGGALERLARRDCPGTHPAGVRRRVVCGDVATELGRLPGQAFDVVLAGYVLHHFTTPQKPHVLDDLARILEDGGWLVWTDLVRSGDESREDLLGRIADDIQHNWSALGTDERARAVEHMMEFDFPESDSWMIEQLERRGLAFERWLFRDAFYGSLLSRNLA